MSDPKPQMTLFLSAKPGIPNLILKGKNKPQTISTRDVKDLVLAAVIQNKLINCADEPEGAYISIWDVATVEAAMKAGGVK